MEEKESALGKICETCELYIQTPIGLGENIAHLEEYTGGMEAVPTAGPRAEPLVRGLGGGGIVEIQHLDFTCNNQSL